MANDSKKLEDRLLELGKGLASPPSSADELYSLLDVIDGLLSSVEQSPLPSMLEALQPLMKALSVKEFLRHSNMDVKVAVASCISEITRITAPEAPYDDDIMKEIFQMIVEAFEGLDDTSSRSFQKRVSILETVAKVRSCVVMLDLECDALILQMFHHFLKTIRTDHSENVFSSMDTIMTLVIDESEDVSSELLSALLDSVKKDNKDVLPIAEKLAAKVMGTCASKLKPYLAELVLSTGASLTEYNNIVASICQESSGGALDHDEAHVSREVLADDSKLSERTVSDELPQVSAKLEHEVGCPEKVGTAAERLPTAATSNGDVQMGNGDTMEQPSSPKQKSERSRGNGQSKNVASDGNDIDNVESIAVKPDDTTALKKTKSRKADSVQLTDNKDRVDSDKDAPVVTNRRKGRSKDGGTAQEGETAVALAPEKKNELQHHPGSEGPTSDTLPSPISSPPNSSRSKRGRPPGRKGAAKRSDVDAIADTPASASVHTDPSENSLAHDEVMPSKGDDSKEPEDADDVEAPTALTSDSEVKPRGSAGKKGRYKGKVVERESSGRKQSSKMKQQKEEGAHRKDVGGEPSLKEMASSPKSSSKAPSVDETHLDDCVKPKSRRKRALETEEMPETLDQKKELVERLVGSRIKVWWPDDKMFYEGTVDSYDPVLRKHKIVYIDGDVEVLLLKNERWEYAESDSENNGGKRKAEGSASHMPQSKKAKGSSNATSKQAKSQTQSKSGTEYSSRVAPRPRGRPRTGTSNVGKLSYDDSPGSSSKSKGKSASSDKEKTRSSGKKMKDEPGNEPKDGTPRTTSKREESGNKSKNVASKPCSASKGDTFKNSGKPTGEPSKSGRKSKNETLKASTKQGVDTPKGSKSGNDTGNSKDSIPKTASKSETDEVGMKKTPGTKSKTTSTPKTGGDSKANGVSSEGKAKVVESENTAPVSDGEATTGGRKRKRRGRK